jgi:hypothetical protein
MCLACELDALWMLYREQQAAATKSAGQSEAEVVRDGSICVIDQAAASAAGVPEPLLNCEERANE